MFEVFKARYCSDAQARRKWLIYGGGATVFTVVLIIIIAVATSGGGDDVQTHFRGRDVLDHTPLIDGHNDLPHNLYLLEKNQINDFNFNSNLLENERWDVNHSHTDIPRLIKGKIGTQFWVAYTFCDTQFKDAVARTMEQIDVMKRLIEANKDKMQYVTTVSGIRNAFENNKIGSILCVEGGHSMDSRLAMLRIYYELGVRYMTLTHSCDTPWASSSATVNTTLRLTEFGKLVVKEMNRLGMMVDISHTSKEVQLDAIEVSRAPVIYSHSSAYGVTAHHRNVDDEVLLKLKDNNGIIMVNFYSEFVAETNATIDSVIKHLNYIKDKIGYEHIGIGADYDGVEAVPEGLEDVSKYPELFDRLAESGHGYIPWTREELTGLAGENLLRVFSRVEAVRDELRTEKPHEDLIPSQDIVAAGEIASQCLSNFEHVEGETTVEPETTLVTEETTTVVTEETTTVEVEESMVEGDTKMQ